MCIDWNWFFFYVEQVKSVNCSLTTDICEVHVFSLFRIFKYCLIHSKDTSIKHIYILVYNLKLYITVEVNWHYCFCVYKGRPDIPRNIKLTCKATGAIVQWISSFNGGDTQNFTVITLSGQDGNSHYYNLNDKGQNEIHATYVSSLQPSVTYWFSVSAKNRHGSISSKAMSCTTVKGYIETFVN